MGAKAGHHSPEKKPLCCKEGRILGGLKKKKKRVKLIGSPPQNQAVPASFHFAGDLRTSVQARVWDSIKGSW